MVESKAGSKPRLLAVGDAVAPTGFARVMEAVLDPLRDRFEIHHLGINYFGDPHGLEWKVYPAGIGGDPFGIGRIADLVTRLKPDLVFMVNDLWVLADTMTELAKLDAVPPVVVYCPVEAGPLDPDHLRALADVRRFVVYTEFGRKEVEAGLARARQDDPEMAFADIEVIPHGVDSSVFYPLEGGVEDGEALSGRQRARRKIFPHSPEFLDGLIVLNANRNQPRKRIDTTMRGFALFAEDKPENVKLFLHMGRKDSGWDLVKLAQYLGLEDRLILSTFEDDMPGVSRSHLNLIYNACDVGLNTASSEGWGLANFEHGATGAAQVLPRHSAFADLWDGAAVMVEPVAELIQEQLLIRAWLVSPEGVAAALQRLYDDPDELTEMSNLAWTLANRPEFRWQAISERWRAIFEAAIKKPT